MLISGVFSLLGTIAVFIAAILISSKKAINPKVRIWAFTAYIWACIFLMIFGMVLNPTDWFMVSQQIFLFFINLKGIKNARKDIKKLSGEKTVNSGRFASDTKRVITDSKPEGEKGDLRNGSRSNGLLTKPPEKRESDSKPSELKRDPFEVTVPDNFWDDILKGDSDNEY